MFEATKRLENIVGSKKQFSYSQIISIAQMLNHDEKHGIWNVAVQPFAFEKRTHLSLFLNDSDLHPTYRFIAVSSGDVKLNKVMFKLKDFSADSGQEKSVVWN